MAILFHCPFHTSGISLSFYVWLSCIHSFRQLTLFEADTASFDNHKNGEVAMHIRKFNDSLLQPF